MDVGERIRARRDELGLTQAQLADELGVTHQHVSGIESGISAPSLDLLVRIARRLGVSTDFLLTGESPLVLDAEGGIRADGGLPAEAKKRLVSLVQLMRDYATRR
jgi:transcriptional regulator with XRE-family HTH domain